MSTLTYRRAEESDLPEIGAFHRAHGKDVLSGPATPYVCCDESGRIVAVVWKLLAWHVDSLVGESGSGFSVAEFHKIIDRDFEQLAEETGETITYMTFVHDTDRGRVIAEKTGMIRMDDYLPYYKVIEPPIIEAELIEPIESTG